MAALPELFRRPSTSVDRIAVEASRQEQSVVLAEVHAWARREVARVDVEARSAAARHALQEDERTHDLGMQAAAGKPVMAEIALRYLEDQNNDNRARVRRV